MPHCGKQLYLNLLHENWDVTSLKNLIVIGNSFQSYYHRTLDAKDTNYINKVIDITNEIKND